MSKHTPKILLILFAAAAVMVIPQRIKANTQYFLSGIVRDSISGEPVAGAAVNIDGAAAGTLTNDRGIFELTAPDSATRLVVSCLGFERKTVDIHRGRVNLYDIQLSPTTTQLQEVVVHRGRYSKKNNPAVDLAKRIHDGGPLTDPLRNDYYNYDKHELITLALNDFAAKDENTKLFRQMPWLWEHVDTSEISGKPILNLIAKEKTAEMHYRKSPSTMREIVTGVRQEGIDEMIDQGSVAVMLEDIFPEIDIYNNDINLLRNRFVSPLSPIAPDFYKFYITDTVTIGDERCTVLSFYPHNPSGFGFNGQIYVNESDGTPFVKKVIMRVPKNINLNFIQNLYLTQEFERAPDGSRLKTRDDLTIEASVLPNQPAIYARRNVAYNNHDFTRPEDMKIFSGLSDRVVDKNADRREAGFWDENRMLTVTENEQRVGQLMERLRGVPAFYWAEKLMQIFFADYIPTARQSKIDIGPINTIVSYNPVEGYRFGTGLMTTANLNNRLFASARGAYGMRDHRWKYHAEVEYSFNDKRYHPNEFPIHSLKLQSSYDTDFLGQHYLFTNQDNVVLSWRRMDDRHATYRRLNRLVYTLELPNNFSVSASVFNVRQEATPWVPMTDGYGKSYGHYTENGVTVTLRYAPGEKFYQATNGRIPINQDAPVMTLSHTFAPQGTAGSMFTVNATELSFKKRFWLSAFGYTDIMVKGGHVWSRSPYINLFIPNANLSYTIQPESFALMNPLEFVNDTYAACDITYWLNGALLNYVPLVKKLKLREVVTFRGWWGQLSERNNPSLNPQLFTFPTDTHITEMTGTPYMEIAAGLDNILKCIRLDYVWRLSYLDVPYQIDRRGLRVALHLTF